MKTSNLQSQTRNALSARIKEASKDRATLLRLEKAVHNHFNNGTITARAFAQLDTMVMQRLARI